MPVAAEDASKKAAGALGKMGGKMSKWKTAKQKFGFENKNSMGMDAWDKVINSLDIIQKEVKENAEAISRTSSDIDSEVRSAAEGLKTAEEKMRQYRKSFDKGADADDYRERLRQASMKCASRTESLSRARASSDVESDGEDKSLRGVEDSNQ